MITDNGNPWGQQNGPTRLTRLSVWLIRLGIRPLWSRPRHPQTMGKIERLHRTLKVELLQGRRFSGFEAAQAGLDTWRRHYNHDRPHEALDGAVPASRYLMSQRSMPASLPADYLDDDLVGRIPRTAACTAAPTEAPSTSSSPSPSPTNWPPSARQPRTEFYHVWFSRYRIAEVDFRTNPERPGVTHLFAHL